MTSRISSSKIRMEDLRHRISAILIVCFVFFMKELSFFIALQNAVLNQESERWMAIDRVMNVMNGPGLAHFFYILFLAIILGVNAFHYIHDKGRVDFMHSLPVKRGRLFGIILSNGILIFLLPYAVSLLIHMGIMALFSSLTTAYLALLLQGSIANLLMFLLIYLLMVTAMLLTGQTFVALLAFGTMATYSSTVLHNVIDLYGHIFLATYSKVPEGIASLLHRISPMDQAITLMIDEKPPYLFAILWILILLGVTCFLYKKRPSESAGFAMAFGRGQKLIKTLVTIPMAMLVGDFFYEMTMESSYLWLYFGVIFGGILFHGLVECIYRSDVRGLWSCKKDLVVLLVFTLLFVLAFEVDILGFDRYRPQGDEVEEIHVEGFLYNDYDIGSLQAENEKEIKGISGADKDALINELHHIQDNMADKNNMYKRIEVTYYMKDGSEKYRAYMIKEEEMDPLGEILFASSDFKTQICPLFRLEEDSIIELTADHPLGNLYLKLSKEEQKEFLDILKEEYAALSYEEAKNEYAVCQVSISYRMVSRFSQDGGCTIGVYPSFEKTIAFLGKHGATIGSSAKNLNLSMLTYDEYDGEDNSEKKIRDKDFINSIKDQLYFEELASGNVQDTGEAYTLYGTYMDETYFFRTSYEVLEKIMNYKR